MTKIFSVEKWNDAEIDLIEGCQYKYKASGKWIDWFIECDADGYCPFLNFLMDLFLRWTKRTPSAKWFQLVGVVAADKDKPPTVDKDTPPTTVQLGTEGTFHATKNGRLWVYANDASFAYGNNRGYIELEITPM
jgi:hypothetical protein